jgi:hypothetical protein
LPLPPDEVAALAIDLDRLQLTGSLHALTN